MGSYKKQYIINLMIKIKQKFQWLILTMELLAVNSSAHQFSIHKPQDKTPIEEWKMVAGQLLYYDIFVKNSHEAQLSCLDKFIRYRPSKETKRNNIKYMIEQINYALTFALFFNQLKQEKKTHTDVIDKKTKDKFNQLIARFKNAIKIGPPFSIYSFKTINSFDSSSDKPKITKQSFDVLLDHDNLMDNDLKKIVAKIDNMTDVSGDKLEKILGDLHKYNLKDFTGPDGKVDLTPYFNDEEDNCQIIKKKIYQNEVEELRLNKKIFFIFFIIFCLLVRRNIVAYKNYKKIQQEQ
jgi:hypothetical protein